MLRTKSHRVLFGFVLSLAVSIGLHWSIFPLDIQGHHNWRQSQTMWNVRNFLRYDNDILNPRVSHLNGRNHDNTMRYEFPVMQWGIAQVQRVFGDATAVARVCVWIIGVFGLAGFYLLLRTMGFAAYLSLAGTALLQFSPLFYFYTVNVLPDLLAHTAAIWYLYFTFHYIRSPRTWTIFAAALFLLLATLAKLPFAMFGIVGVVYFFRHLLSRGQLQWRVVGFAVVHLLLILPAVKWYTWVMPGWGDNPVVYGIFASTNTYEQNVWIFRHYYRQYFPYDLLSPAMWLFGVLGVVWPARRDGHPGYRAYVWALALITLLYVALQWNTITIVHDYYLFPLLPWLYIVVTAGAGRLLQLFANRGRPKIGYALVWLAVLASPVLAYQQRQKFWDVTTSYRYAEFEDAFRYREALQDAADDDAIVIALNDNSFHILTWLIRKRGYVFSQNSLQPLWIKDLVDNHGAAYLYSTSRKIDQDPAAATYLDSLVLEAGQVHVYKLAAPEK